MSENNNLNVLIFIASSLKGGAERLVVTLANELIEIEVDVTVVAYKNSAWINELSNRVTLIEIRGSESHLNLHKYIQILNVINKTNPDVVNSHGAKASAIIRRISRIKPIVHVATKHNVRKGKVFNKISNVISVSKAVAQSISHSSKVIYNGTLGLERKVPIQNKKDNFSVLAIGRLDPVKRFPDLIKCFSQLDDAFTLKIAGEGPQRKELLELIENERLDSRVKLLGQRSDIHSLMQNSWCVIVCSKSEGFSLVITEALHYANMLLSTNVGISQEILPKELLFKIDNLVQKIKTTQEDYENYQNIFKNVVNDTDGQFSTANMALAYKEYFKKIINKT
jgi:glycosyltransferase involved in cell wall biosynthesis